MTSHPKLILTVAAVVAWCGEASRGQIIGSSSSQHEFLTTPYNITVPKGEKAVLPCLVGGESHVCRWYFMKLGRNFFDQRENPMLVKEFNPHHKRDCSIMIKKVRKVQEGQWLCQALKIHSTQFIMTNPAVLRVITEDEIGSWPPTTSPRPNSSREGHREQETNITPDNTLKFFSSQEDYIKNAEVGDPVVLKCQVNMPISACSWVMPSEAFFNVSQETVGLDKPSIQGDDYRLVGNISEGNCSLRVRKVQLEDEGDWRCVVTAGEKHHSQGPLLHLHISTHPSLHSHNGTPLIDPEDDSMTLLVIVLVVTCSILLITVLMLFTCLYRRIKDSSEETCRILPASPRGTLNLHSKTLPNTDLTGASVLAVEVRKKGPHSLSFDHYNQYLDMSGAASSAEDYIIMPGSSVRSSTSSRTTLSLLSTQPSGRSRSASSSTSTSADFPHLITLVDNPSYNTSPRLPRPTSLYKTDHIYEEIKEKDHSEKMEKIPEVKTPITPTYTNILKDAEGYLIPKKSPSKEILSPQSTQVDPKSTMNNSPPHSNAFPTPLNPAPPYSQVGEHGLVPAGSTQQQQTPSPGPGYSRVGCINPVESYDTPRPLNPMERYDVPRGVSVESVLQSPNIPSSSEASVNLPPATIV